MTHFVDFSSIQKRVLLPLAGLFVIVYAIAALAVARSVDAGVLVFGRPVMIVLAAGLIAALLLAYALVRTMRRDITELCEKVDDVARTAIPEAVLIQGTGEIGQLAAAIQRMLISLHESQQNRLEREELAAVNRVATSIAHEVRGPLAALKRHVEELQQETGPHESERRAVKLLNRELVRLDMLVDEMLYFSKPSPLHSEQADTTELIDAAVEMMDDKLEEQQTEVHKNYAKELPPIMLDPLRFQQALMNLIQNAVQAMPGGGRLTLRARSDAEEVVVECEDTGRGIPDEARQAIFEPFFTTQEGGVGLGLAVTRLIVEEHGGSLTCESRQSGTLFRLKLPR